MPSHLLYVDQVAPYRDRPAGVHGVLGQSVTALSQLAEVRSLSFVHVDDVRRLPLGDLASAAAVALFTIGETPWSVEQRAALLDGVRSGRTAVVSIHAATDSCYGWDEYGSLVGARFNGHPWTQEVTLQVREPAHPALAHLGPTWRWRDEVYQFRDLRPDARVLLEVPDEELDLGADGVVRPAFGFPLSWCFAEGRGRVFSTSLGHFPAAWENPTYLAHLSGGLAWALGEGD
ncbi:MAG TPA: ThuA domain-containing protein [Acidimicrobiales bacterium]|nr:ThuA domain-containing protein [Acidimicrobiales bacterium]